MEAAANKYLAAPVEELCENRMRLLKEAEGYLRNNLLPVEEETEGYITIEGYRHIQDKIYAMLQKAEKRIYLSLSELADKEKTESLKSKHRRPIGFIHYDNEE